MQKSPQPRALFFILCRKAALYRVTERTLPFVSVSDAPKTIPLAAG